MNKKTHSISLSILIFLITIGILFHKPVHANQIDYQWWQTLPIYPTLTEKHRNLYQEGIKAGNDPTYFVVIGDCQTMTGQFLGPYYNLDEYMFPPDATNLMETIAFFRDKSIKFNTPGNMDGANAASHLAPGRPIDYIEGGVCFENESSLQCELRAYQPSIAFIRLGTHWGERDSSYLRQIVKTLVDANVLPILATKVGNHEGDNSINHEIAAIANEFDLPLWNLWAAMQGLPDQGLDPESIGGYMHLSESGKEIQRFSALQILDSVWRYVR